MTRNDIKRQTLIEWGKKCEISSHKVFARLENISTIVFSEYEVTKKKERHTSPMIQFILAEIKYMNKVNTTKHIRNKQKRRMINVWQRKQKPKMEIVRFLMFTNSIW